MLTRKLLGQFNEQLPGFVLFRIGQGLVGLNPFQRHGGQQLLQRRVRPTLHRPRLPIRLGRTRQVTGTVTNTGLVLVERQLAFWVVNETLLELEIRDGLGEGRLRLEHLANHIDGVLTGWIVLNGTPVVVQRLFRVGEGRLAPEPTQFLMEGCNLRADSGVGGR